MLLACSAAVRQALQKTRQQRAAHRIVVLALGVAQHLQALAVAGGQQCPLGDLLLNTCGGSAGGWSEGAWLGALERAF